MPAWLLFVIIGLLGGVASGLFGVGGGIVIVPALIYWAGFSQHKATGTSLAVLLPPIGLAAALQYYRHGNVDVRAAIILAATMFVGAWIGADVANITWRGHNFASCLVFLSAALVCTSFIVLVSTLVGSKRMLCEKPHNPSSNTDAAQ